MEVKVVLLIASFVSCGLTGGGEQETSPKNYGGKEPLSYMPSIPELSPSIKDPVIWKNGTRLLFFYTPWCSHSQFMKPLLYELIEQLYYHNVSGILVGQLDISIHSDVARTFRIKATPTLLLLLNGTRYEFIDEVTVDNMVQFVMKILGPSLTEVTTAVEVQEILDQRPVVFLLIHDEEINNEWQIVYTRVSQERVLIGHFLYTTNTDLPSDMGFKVGSLPGLVVLKDNHSYLYTDTLSKYRMTLWVESEQFPSLPTANGSTLRYFMHAGIVKRLVILVLASKEHRSIAHKKAYEAVKRVATSRKLHSGYQFLILEDKDLAERIVQMSLTLPALFVWEHHTGYYFLHEEKTYTEKGVASFLFSVTAGKIQAQGGPTFWTTLRNCYWWLHNLLKIMLSHRPILSLVAIVLFLAGFIIFVYSRCSRPKPIPKQNQQEAIARERARKRARRNQTRRQRETQMSSEDGTTDEEKKDQ